MELGGPAWLAHVLRCAGSRGLRPSVSVRAAAGGRPAPPAGPPVFAYGDFCGVADDKGALALVSPRGAVAISAGGDEVAVSARDGTPCADWPEVHFALIEALRRQGLYQLHAAVAARDDRCLVVLGASGAGKTTVALQLARTGWDLLSDDSVFVFESPLSGQVECIGWPDPVRVTPWLAERVHGLADALEPAGDGKLQVTSAASMVSRREWAAPRTLWLLMPGDRSAPSRLRAMGPVEAFGLLVPLCPLLMASRDHVASHAALLGRLLAQAVVMGATLGEDLLDPVCAESLATAPHAGGSDE